ncbi:MAG: hypothetical protein JO297_08305 [Nitrososphaeraceae archaeon]|nr:hypothetical protein [Nitrososphaeraceae archaeon]
MAASDMCWNNDIYYPVVLIHMKLKLNLNIGNGYMDGDAANDNTSFKINIQQGWPDTVIIVPTDLKLNAGRALITFDTEKGNQIPVKVNLKSEDTDMIRLFTDLQTLVNLTKSFPVTMDIQKDSGIG